MKKNYVKMNNNNILSLGNFFNAIKKYSMGTSAVQKEIFCSIFQINDINITTVNNYLVGLRAIGIEYKKIYNDLNELYKDDKLVFVDIILSIMSILDENLYLKNDNSINLINNNKNLLNLANELLIISKKDHSISSIFINKQEKLINDNLYEAIINFLNYTILFNKQPIYEQRFTIKINKKEMEDYLKVRLYEGASYITSLKILADMENMYALAELGSLEFSGLIKGIPDYNKSYYYYEKAANKNHPKACFMIANLIFNKKVIKNKKIMFNYLKKGILLESAAAINLMGKCYLTKDNPSKKVNVKKARDYFIKSSEMGYVFAFNNLGMISENNDEMIKYYKISADMENSWALNKIGEYYRLKKDNEKAYYYYRKATLSPISERTNWAYYNLYNYFYDKLSNDEKIKFKEIIDLNNMK